MSTCRSPIESDLEEFILIAINSRGFDSSYTGLFFRGKIIFGIAKIVGGFFGYRWGLKMLWEFKSDYSGRKFSPATY